MTVGYGARVRGRLLLVGSRFRDAHPRSRAGYDRRLVSLRGPFTRLDQNPDEEVSAVRYGDVALLHLRKALIGATTLVLATTIAYEVHCLFFRGQRKPAECCESL